MSFPQNFFQYTLSNTKANNLHPENNQPRESKKKKKLSHRTYCFIRASQHSTNEAIEKRKLQKGLLPHVSEKQHFSPRHRPYFAPPFPSYYPHHSTSSPLQLYTALESLDPRLSNSSSRSIATASFIPAYPQSSLCPSRIDCPDSQSPVIKTSFPID